MERLQYYRYVAVAGSETKRAALEAKDEREVRAMLREQGMVPLVIKRSWKADRLQFKRVSDGRSSLKELFAAPPEASAEAGKLFHYKAIVLETGKPQEGDLNAESEREVRQLLRDRGMIPSLVRPKKTLRSMLSGNQSKALEEAAPKLKKKKKSEPSPFFERLEQMTVREVPTSEILFYVSQLATMNESGLAFSQSMEILTNLITHKRLKAIHVSVREQIMQGVSLSEAYHQYQRELPNIFTELIAVGEISGNLDHALSRLKTYLESQVELNKKIKGAMTYPMVMIGLITLIVTGLMIFVVPTFVKLFDSFHVVLPPTTRALLALSWFITHRGYLIPVFAIGGFISYKAFMSSSAGREVRGFLEFRLPIVGKLAYKIMISRILHNLGLFLNCGITIVAALDMISEAVTNKMVLAKLNVIRAGITQGERLSTLFIKTELFPPLVNYLLVAGEEAGQIDELIERGAIYVDKEVEGAIKALTSAIEPMLTVVIAGVILFVIGSLYLPMMSLMKGGHGGAM